jgi:HSP20 family protein
MSQLLPEHRSSVASERWQPLTELDQVSERMRRMLEQTFGGLGWPSPLREAAGWSPLVDIEETDDAFVVEAELPGVQRQDVNVELVGRELTITGEIKERERKGTLRRRARRTGRFEYRVSLPDQVDAEKIEAKLAEGVLTVRVPKSERAPRRQIEIKS